MAADKRADFLVEIGTEELPPKALRKLMTAFASNLETRLDEHRLVHGPINEFATPRRIAALVPDLALAQESREVDAKGPPVSIAFDDAGEAKPPAVAFAKKWGVDVADLGRAKTDKGEWLSYRSVEKGLAAAELLPVVTAVRGAPNATLLTATLDCPRLAFGFPHRHVDHVGVGRMDLKVDGAASRRDVEHTLPRFAAVLGAVDAAFFVVAPKSAERGDVDDVGVGWVHFDVADLERLAKPHVLPGLAGVF